MNPVIVALDVAEGHSAHKLAAELRPHVGGFKVGLELIMAEGAVIIAQIAELGLPVFADAKLHDIPNTVSAAARKIGQRGARWVTVHSSGGREMIEAAVEGFAAGGGGGVLAVTVLTSMAQSDLEETGFQGDLAERALTLAGLAAASGAEGVVCSPLEVSELVAAQPALLKVTPGIRPEGMEVGDQKRTATPVRALAMGADLLVIGRAITSAPSPAKAAAEIARSVGIFS